MVVLIFIFFSIWYSCGFLWILIGLVLVGIVFGVELEIFYVCCGLCVFGFLGEGVNGIVLRFFVFVDCFLRMFYFVFCICSCD